jgi:hypothetical protein
MKRKQLVGALFLLVVALLLAGSFKGVREGFAPIPTSTPTSSIVYSPAAVASLRRELVASQAALNAARDSRDAAIQALKQNTDPALRPVLQQDLRSKEAVRATLRERFDKAAQAFAKATNSVPISPTQAIPPPPIPTKPTLSTPSAMVNMRPSSGTVRCTLRDNKNNQIAQWYQSNTVDFKGI